MAMTAKQVAALAKAREPIKKSDGKGLTNNDVVQIMK